MIGPLPLRIEIAYEPLRRQGRDRQHDALGPVRQPAGGRRLRCSIGWSGPGYYQSTVKTQIAGHNVNGRARRILGAQAALGVNIPVFRWQGYLEVGGVKLFAPGPTIMYVPLRFGMRL